VPWFLNFLVLSVAHRGGKEISALDNTFALIDEYICADLSSRPNFPLQSCDGPYICRYYEDHFRQADLRGLTTALMSDLAIYRSSQNPIPPISHLVT